jgi:hypothetical protein
VADFNRGRNPMHAVVLAVLSSGLVAADVPLPEELAVVDRTEVQGDWEWVSCRVCGQDWWEDDLALYLLSFENGRCVWSFRHRIQHEGPFDLVPSVPTAGIALRLDLDSYKLSGIYRVHGDWMDLAVARYSAFPTQFVSKQGSDVILWRLHRIKK